MFNFIFYFLNIFIFCIFLNTILNIIYVKIIYKFKIQICEFTSKPKSITGLGMIKRKMLAGTQPNITITIDGNKCTIVTKITVKTITLSFTLGEEYEADPGTGETKKVNKSRHLIIIIYSFAYKFTKF